MEKLRARMSHEIAFTTFIFDYNFHGGFLLAYTAKTSHVLIVDDDRMIDTCMRQKLGV